MSNKKIKRVIKRITICFLFASIVPCKGQYYPTNITLNSSSPTTGQQEYIASQSIIASPVYSYKATAGEFVHAFIDKGAGVGTECNLLFDNYTDPGSWTSALTTAGECTIAGGAFNYVGCEDANVERFYKNIGALGTSWGAACQFTPTSVCPGAPGCGNFPGATIMALTAGNQDPYTSGPPSYTSTNQNALTAIYEAPLNDVNPKDWSLLAEAKIGTTVVAVSAANIVLTLGTTYYILLQQLDATTAQISAFTDAAMTVPVPGSPECFSWAISGSLTGLNTLQHGGISDGSGARFLWGTLTNTCITTYSYSAGSYSYSYPVGCSGSPGPSFASTAAASGGSWVWTYQWQQSPDNVNWTNIAGATGVSYNAPTLSAPTYFQRVAIGPCGLTISVENSPLFQPPYQPTTVSISESPITSNCQSTVTLTANVSNSVGASYRWNTGAITPTITVPVPTSGSTTYSVTVSNPCYSATANTTVNGCWQPSGAFPQLTGNANMVVNWSGNCSGDGLNDGCYLQIDDNTLPEGAGPAYNADAMELLVYDRWDNLLYDKQYTVTPCSGFWNGIVSWNGVYDNNPVPWGYLYGWTLIRTNTCTGASDVTKGAVMVQGVDGVYHRPPPDTSVTTGDKNIALSNVAMGDGFKVFPNPTNGVFTIVSSESTEDISANGYKIKVTDILGNVVYQQENVSTSFLKVDLSSKSSGMYLVRVITPNGQVSVQKIVLMK